MQVAALGRQVQANRVERAPQLVDLGGEDDRPIRTRVAGEDAAAQPSPKIAEPTVFALESSGVAGISVPLMLSAATISASLSGCSCIACPASLISGTPLAQPTPLMWYLSVVGSIS